MREMEFLELQSGDIIHPLKEPNDPWTVVGYQPGHETFFIIRGEHNFTMWSRLIWYVIMKLPDEICLEMAGYLEIRVARIVNPANWSRGK